MSRAWRGGSTRSWRRLRAFVLTRDGYRCQFPVGAGVCGALATHADHIVPRLHGGQDVPENVRAACATHNLRRGAGRPVAVERKPAPVRRWSW